jgi:hypothetical protein
MTVTGMARCHLCALAHTDFVHKSDKERPRLTDYITEASQTVEPDP